MSACIDPGLGWSRHSGGYRVRNIGGVLVFAHRRAWEARRGPIAKGIILHHTCRNQSCINTEHLVPMTQSEHIALHAREDGTHNSRKTHCPQGHEYAGRNLLVKFRGNGKAFRQCRICSNASGRDRKRRNRREAARRRT